MTYLSALPSVWSSPSIWNDAAVSVAPESCDMSAYHFICMARSHTYDAYPVAIDCGINLLVRRRCWVYDRDWCLLFRGAWHFDSCY
jgi:hypothetical protein